MSVHRTKSNSCPTFYSQGAPEYRNQMRCKAKAHFTLQPTPFLFRCLFKPSPHRSFLETTLALHSFVRWVFILCDEVSSPDVHVPNLRVQLTAKLWSKRKTELSCICVLETELASYFKMEDPLRPSRVEKTQVVKG